MQIITKLKIDLLCREILPKIDAVQNDANSRGVEISLTAGGSQWQIPAGITAALAFRKPDGTSGLYDKLPDGTEATTISGSTVTAIFAPEMLTVPGIVHASVIFYGDNLNQLATFPFNVAVAENPAAGAVVSNNYYNYQTLGDINKALEAINTALEEVALVVNIDTGTMTASSNALSIIAHADEGVINAIAEGDLLSFSNARMYSGEGNDVHAEAVFRYFSNSSGIWIEYIIDENGNVKKGEIDPVLFSEQNLTEEQQAQARKNIGAGTASVDDTKVGEDAWSSKKITQEISKVDHSSAIVCDASGEVIFVTDASNRGLQGLTLYGKTTQDGTPTPDAPVDLVSVGDGGSVGVTVAGKNLLNFEDLLNECKANYAKDGEKYTIRGLGTGYTNPIRLFKERTTVSVQGVVKNETATGGRIDFGYIEDGSYVSTLASLDEANNSCSNISINAIRLNYTSGGIYTVENPQMELGESVTEYEPYKGQALTASTPNGLPGIPVASGGNYTDENGQQWACDEIDFARGVYVQRVKVADMGAFVWYYTLNRFAAFPNDMAKGYYTPGFCSHYLAVQNKYQIMPDKSVNFNDSGLSGKCCIVVRDDSFTDNEAFKAAVAGATVMYELATPIETALSAEELVQYAALHTNKSNTTVYNDGGAGIAVQYVADTKTYIDNKFNELAAAIVNNT